MFKHRNGRPRVAPSAEGDRLVGPLPYHAGIEELANELGLVREPFEPLAAFLARISASVKLKEAQLRLLSSRLRAFTE